FVLAVRATLASALDRFSWVTWSFINKPLFYLLYIGSYSYRSWGNCVQTKTTGVISKRICAKQNTKIVQSAGQKPTHSQAGVCRPVVLCISPDSLPHTCWQLLHNFSIVSYA